MHALDISPQDAVKNARQVFIGEGKIPANYKITRISRTQAYAMLQDSKVSDSTRSVLCVMLMPCPGTQGRFPLKNKYFAILHSQVDCPKAPDVWLTDESLDIMDIEDVHNVESETMRDKLTTAIEAVDSLQRQVSKEVQHSNTTSEEQQELRTVVINLIDIASVTLRQANRTVKVIPNVLPFRQGG